MTLEERQKVHEQVELVSNLARGALDLIDENDGLVLFEYSRDLIDECCGIMTTLCEIWSARRPTKSEPKPRSRSASLDDLDF